VILWFMENQQRNRNCYLTFNSVAMTNRQLRKRTDFLGKTQILMKF